jgi:PAS domain S-box-containing protein
MTSNLAPNGQGQGELRQDPPGGSLRPLLDASPVPMWAYDEKNSAIVAANERALRQYGYARSQFLAMQVTDLEAGPAPSSIDRAPSERMNGIAEIHHHRKADGTVISMRLETDRVLLEGRPVVLVAAMDVGEQDRALADSERRCRDLAQSEKGLRSALADSEGRNRRLAASELRYRRFFDIASDWFWEVDSNYCFTYVSPNIETAAGLPAAAYLGKRLTETEGVVISPEMAHRVIAAQKAKAPFSDFLYSRNFGDGKVVWVCSTAAPLFGEDGRFLGYCGIARDVTQRIETERAVRESEQQFRELLEASADYSWETDGQYRTTYLSPSYENVFGVPASSALGRRISESPGVAIAPKMGAMVTVAFAQRQPFRDLIYSRKMPDGLTRWIKVSGAPRFDRNGEFIGYRGTGADITRHIEATAATQLGQQHLQEAVAHVSQPIIVYDADDHVAAYNQPFYELHRVPAGGFHRTAATGSLIERLVTRIGQTASPAELAEMERRTDMLIDVPGQPAAINDSRNCFRDHAEWQLSHGFYADGPDDPPIDLETLLARYRSEAEHTYHLRDGRWMQVIYRRLPGGGRVGLWTDVTAIKRAEAERRALEAQLHHSQRLESLGTLAGGAAHEINNALVPVIALTKLVARKLPEGSRERRNLDTVLLGAERSRDLVKQILAFARAERTEQQRQELDVGAVLQDTLQLMRATLPRTIRLEEEIAPVPAITGDPGQLQQAIVNLINNAAQAIGQALGTITVSLHPEGGGSQLRLSIADTGCGIDEATLVRVFEPFFTTKAVGDGSGLGLSVVHGIVKAHGGRIGVKSTPGRGSCFDVFLPLTPARADRAG